MALIQKHIPEEKQTLKIKLSNSLVEQINDYLKFAKLDGDLDIFFEESAKYLLKKDKDYQTHIKEKNES